MGWNISSPRDSRLLPRFTRVDHPTTNAAELLPAEEPASKTLHSAFPTEEWRTDYVRHFLNYRQNLRRALEAPNPPGRPAPAQVRFPNWQKRNEWWCFITGAPRGANETVGEAATNGIKSVGGRDSEDTKGAHEPTIAMLKQFSLRNVTGLLYWFSVWITVYTDFLEHSAVQSSGDENGERSGPGITTAAPESVHAIEGVHQRWMFALLGMLSSELVGGDVSTLRELARAAIRLIQLLTKGDVNAAPPDEDILGVGGDGGGTVDPEGAGVVRDASLTFTANVKDGGTQSTIAGCWMVVAAIVGVWGQRDIWDEAREALSTSS